MVPTVATSRCTACLSTATWASDKVRHCTHLLHVTLLLKPVKLFLKLTLAPFSEFTVKVLIYLITHTAMLPDIFGIGPIVWPYIRDGRDFRFWWSAPRSPRISFKQITRKYCYLHIHTGSGRSSRPWAIRTPVDNPLRASYLYYH